MPENDAKSYLGDGAYVQVGSFVGEVVLTTEDGRSVQNTVVLDEQGTLNLLTWLSRQGLMRSVAVRRCIIRDVDPNDAYEGRLEDRET